MKKSLLAAILISFVATNVIAGQTAIQKGCSVEAQTRDRLKYNDYRTYFNWCVAREIKHEEDTRSQRLQDEANQSTIDANRAYQKNSEDMRRWMRANPGQPYPYATPYSGSSQKTKVNRK